MIDTFLNDRYLLEEELGHGGMGIVYAGKDTLLYRDIAVKVLLSPGLGTEGRSRLLNEARAAAGLNHPGIVSVFDVGVLDESLDQKAVGFIVMERIHGGTLATSKPQSFHEILNILAQTSDALAHAHEQGVIHRDLKPENIAITPDGHVKLMDFGLAKTTSDRALEDSTGISGSLPYIAPEVILGQPSSEQSDLYSLGVVFFELVTGHQPFEADDLAGLLTQMLHSPVTPPSNYNDQIPATVEALILRLLSKQPHRRPSTAREVSRQIDKIRESQLESAGVIGAKPGILNRLVRGRLIGRKQELADLVEMWRQTTGGEGKFALVSGEPGIGKSRLVREVASYANISGGVVLEGQCYAQGGSPYMPLTEVISAALDQVPGTTLPAEVLADLLTLSPELRLSFPRFHGGVQAVASTDRQRLFDAVVMLLVALSNEKPVLVFIDDLHWADSGTLGLVQHLTRRFRQRPLMIIGTYREIELSSDRPLKPYLAQFYQERVARRIKLARLDFTETTALLATLFSSGVSNTFAQSIYKETEGNPFFIEEVCKALIDNGRLTFVDGRWKQTDQARLEIPQGVRLAIQSRLQKLGETEQEILQTAALLGREFEYDMLLAVTDLEEDRLIEILDTAAAYQLVEETAHYGRKESSSQPIGPMVSFTFTHALIQATLLDSLGILQRQRRQLKIARALEETFKQRLSKLAPLLGRYYAEAGVADKAIHFLVQSGDSARNLFAYDEAVRAYKQALLFLEDGQEFALTARTFMKLGLAYHNTFQFEQARRAYEEGFKHWQQAPAILRPESLVTTGFLRTHMLTVPTIDPSRSDNIRSSKIIQQLFSGLVEISPSHEVVPDIAGRWEVLDEGRRYRFFLRDDVVWSDGIPLTAHDFVFSWRRTLEPGTGSFPAELLYDICNACAFHQGETPDASSIGVTAIDDRTLEIELEGPTSYFLNLLTQYIAVPQPRHAIEKWGENWTRPEHLVNNGPFLLESWIPDEGITLTRNSRYHGDLSGNLAEVSVQFISDPDQALQLYEAGDLDYLELIPLLSPEALNNSRRRFSDEYFSGPTASVTFLALNVNKPPMDDVKVRRALAMAIDRNMLVDVALQGIFLPANGGFVPPGIPGHSPELGINFDLTQAAFHLAEAGYPGGRDFPTLQLRVSSGAIYQAIATALKDMWREYLGLEVKFLPVKQGVPSDITLSGVVPEYPDPDSYLRVNSWGPVTGWRNEDFDRLVENARRNPDWDQRMRMYRQADLLLTEELSLVPLAYGRFHSLMKPRIKKYPLSPLSVPRWKDVIIENE